MATKYIFFTGGVVSSVGKGVTAAAIGRLLKERGFKVAVQKLDPYINVDPGTMSPYQHGEVFVLDDGAETDLDLGHYERFIDIRLNRVCNITTGQVYAEVISNERRGDYLGGTIQVIPHITNEIKRRIGLVAKTTGAEIVLVEVGGTVGDIESQPFLEAIRQLRSDLGRENTMYIHVTWLTYIGATGELKTKPTQHSVRELRALGISPDVIVARSDYPVEDDLIEKIALFCDVEKKAVIPMVTTQVLYEIPLVVGKSQRRRITSCKDWDWKPVTNLIGLNGNIWFIRYIVINPPSRSPLSESMLNCMMPIYPYAKPSNMPDCTWASKLICKWVHSAELEKGRGWDTLESVDGIVVPGGFGSRGIEGKIQAAKYARANKVPYLGLCLGMQVLVVEFARDVLQKEEANSTEFDRATAYPVIDLMPEQTAITDKGGTMRLGLYPCVLKPGTIAREAYGVDQVDERHRHRFEFNNDYREQMEAAGMTFPASPRIAAWWKLPNSRIILLCSAHNFIPNSSAGPTGRTRCFMPL